MPTNKFPANWSPATIAVFYALMCDVHYADACYVEQNWLDNVKPEYPVFVTGAPSRWVRYMASLASDLGLSTITSIRARQRIVQDPTDWFPAAANPRMVLQYIAASRQADVSYTRSHDRIMVKLNERSTKNIVAWLIANGFTEHAGVFGRDNFPQRMADWRAPTYT